jgi:hypothetical protein
MQRIFHYGEGADDPFDPFRLIPVDTYNEEFGVTAPFKLVVDSSVLVRIQLLH